ncbi:MAG: hypothetical protein QOD93_434 [Acetobacteraceae bacterium]|jgi:hypothetical protein|nr:hypothetical protein [Acetobacteraceae bacterium]
MVPDIGFFAYPGDRRAVQEAIRGAAALSAAWTQHFRVARRLRPRPIPQPAVYPCTNARDCGLSFITSDQYGMADLRPL